MEKRNAQACVPATMPEKMKWWKALLADKKLSASAKNVAAALLHHHNERTGQCNPSQARLAEAVGLSRMRVNRLVAELKSGGWIGAEGTLGASYYRLNLERAAGAIESVIGAGECVDLDTTPVPDPTYPCVGSDVGGVSDVKYPCVGSEAQNPQEEPTKRTSNLNPAPAEAASEPVAMGPAVEQPTMPDLSGTIPPTPANDDRRDVGVEVFLGWAIPLATIREWERGFSHLDVRAELVRRVRWFVANVPEHRRLSALASKLGKENEIARQAAVARRENKQADTEAKVDRCPFTGRDRARIRGASSRFHIPVVRQPVVSEAS